MMHFFWCPRSGGTRASCPSFILIELIFLDHFKLIFAWENRLCLKMTMMMMHVFLLIFFFGSYKIDPLRFSYLKQVYRLNLLFFIDIFCLSKAFIFIAIFRLIILDPSFWWLYFIRSHECITICNDHVF